MPSHLRIDEPKEVKIIVRAISMEIGEIGRILDGGEAYTGLIVVRAYNGLICIYNDKPDQNGSPAFYTTWNPVPDFEIELLPPNYVIEIHN